MGTKTTGGSSLLKPESQTPAFDDLVEMLEKDLARFSPEERERRVRDFVAAIKTHLERAGMFSSRKRNAGSRGKSRS